jgi:hypothetical protein
MQGLGKGFNVVAKANGVALNMSGCSAITFVGTNDDTYTLTIAKTFAGTYRAYNFFTPNWVPITTGYTNSDNGVGTGQWVKTTQTAASTFVTATDIAGAFTLYGSQMPDGYVYVKCTLSTNDGIGCVAILHDLTVQRGPANLPAVSA